MWVFMKYRSFFSSVALISTLSLSGCALFPAQLDDRDSALVPASWNQLVEYEETIYYPPSDTAGIFLLKNWGNYMNEPRAMEYRKKELELKEKQVEAITW